MMEQAIKKLQDSVTLLSENMIIGFQKSDDNFHLLNRKMDLLDRRVELLEKTVDLLGKKVDDNFESLNKRIDLLQGNSFSTIESLEKGINEIKSELQKISVVTRYENDYFYLINPKNGLPK